MEPGQPPLNEDELKGTKMNQGRDTYKKTKRQKTTNRTQITLRRPKRTTKIEKGGRGKGSGIKIF